MSKTWREFYGGDHLNADHLTAEGRTATIASVEGEVLEDEDGKLRKCAVVTFAETPTRWAVNTINRICIEAMFGLDVDDAIGHKVTLFADACEVKGQFFGQPSVRVKGSPELHEPINVTIKLPRRKPFTRVLVPTGAQG